MSTISSNDMSEQLVDVNHDGDAPERLRFTGKQITWAPGIEIYVTLAGHVLVVFEDGYEKFADAEAYSEWVSMPGRNGRPRDEEEALAYAAAELGQPRVTDID